MACWLICVFARSSASLLVGWTRWVGRFRVPAVSPKAADLQPVSKATKDLLDFSVLHGSEMRFRIDTSHSDVSISAASSKANRAAGLLSQPPRRRAVQRPLLRITVVGDDTQSIFFIPR